MRYLWDKWTDWYLIKRRFRYFWQRRTRGWDDSVTWNLDEQIAIWLAPRMRRFQEIKAGHPAYMEEEKEWDDEIEEMCWALEWYVEYCHSGENPEDQERAMQGINKIAGHFPYLWW